MTVRGALLGVAIFGVFALAYVWASPSLAHQHWDSLDYAAACEVRGPRALWRYHPLGHLVGCGVFTVVRGLGHGGRALPIMKLVNGVTAAAAVTALFVVLTTVLRVGRLRSVGWSLVMGSAYGFWHYAGTAEIYGMSVLFLIVAWGVTVWSFDRPSRGGHLLSGIACGAATLCHQLGGVILMIGTIALLAWADGRGRRRLATFGTFAAATALTIVVGYGLLGLLATGSSSPARLVRWAIGHLHDSTYGHFFTPDGLSLALQSAVTTLLPPRWPWPFRFLVFGVVTWCLAFPLVATLWIRRLPGRSKALALASALQCLAGCLLIAWWEPSNRKLWLLTLPAFVMWCEVALTGLGRGAVPGGVGSGARRRWPLDAVPVLAGALLFLSSGAVMLRERQPDVRFEQSLSAWVGHSRPDDVLIENGRLTAHLLFWARRPNTVNLYPIIHASRGEPDRFVALRELIEQAARKNHAVLLSPALDRYYTDERLARVGVTRRQVQDFFDQYRREGPLFEYHASDDGSAQPVYRLAERAR